MEADDLGSLEKMKNSPSNPLTCERRSNGEITGRFWSPKASLQCPSRRKPLYASPNTACAAKPYTLWSTHSTLRIFIFRTHGRSVGRDLRCHARTSWSFAGNASCPAGDEAVVAMTTEVTLGRKEMPDDHTARTTCRTRVICHRGGDNPYSQYSRHDTSALDLIRWT